MLIKLCLNLRLRKAIKLEVLNNTEHANVADEAELIIRDIHETKVKKLIKWTQKCYLSISLKLLIGRESHVCSPGIEFLNLDVYNKKGKIKSTAFFAPAHLSSRNLCIWMVLCMVESRMSCQRLHTSFRVSTATVFRN